MKKLLLLPIVASFVFPLIYLKGFDLDLHHLIGRCSGSNAYCSACSNCSACKNCAVNGGSCAVCYTPKLRKSKRTVGKTKLRSTSNSRIASNGPSKSYHRVVQQTAVSPITRNSTIGTGNAAPIHSRESNQSEENRVVSEGAAQAPDQFLPPQPNTGEAYSVTIPSDAEIIMVISGKANLRESATTNSAIVEEISYGSLLMKLGQSGNWVKVQTIDSGTVGFIFSDLVQ